MSFSICVYLLCGLALAGVNCIITFEQFRAHWEAPNRWWAIAGFWLGASIAMITWPFILGFAAMQVLDRWRK